MSGIVGDNFFRASGVVATSSTEYDDSQIQSNIAVLGFYVAVNGSLVRYNLVDQSIDEYFDTSGVDASASTNEVRSDASPYYYYGGTVTSPTVTEDADDSGVDGDYTWYKWTDTGATGSYNNNTTQDTEYLIVAGGGAGGGNYQGAGGGAGGYLAATGLSLTGGNAYTITIGAGGVGTVGGVGTNGGDSILSGTGISTLTADGGGFGGAPDDHDGADGGSGGGGAGWSSSPGGSATTDQGFDGGTSAYAGGGSGGGGASEAGSSGGAAYYGGDGGDGLANDIGSASATYAGGGGGGAQTGSGGSVGSGGAGGGGAGGGDATNGVDGTANTGGGGGGVGNNNPASAIGGDGGTGVVFLRRVTSPISTGADLTLQSTDVTAEAEPSYGELVMLIENAYGTATLNTDIKGYVSCDSGVTFAQGTLLDEGTWGTNKQILGFHDLDISSQTGTSMCYKITTHNQSAASKETRIYATSIGWR